MDLARRPERLAAALQIDQQLDGVDLGADGPLGLALRFEKQRRLAQVCESVLPVRSVGYTASLRRATLSLAAPRPSRRDKKSLALSQLELSSRGRNPKISIGGYKRIEVECPI
jgi:hypothetical protein